MGFIIYFLVMIAFSIGPINIYWYGIFYLFGFLLGYLFLKLVGKYKIFAKYVTLQDLLYKYTDDILIAIVLGVLLGGRLGEVFIYQWSYYSVNLMQIFAVWNGGMSFIGGIVGVLIALLFLKRIKKLSWIEFWLLLDLIVAIVPLAILFGRLGNYLNQELYGIIVPDGAWGLSSFLVEFFKGINIFHIYNSVDDALRVNTNFLAMIFEGFTLFLITSVAMFRRIKLLLKNGTKTIRSVLKPGFIVGLFLIFYSLFRFFLEYLRVDSQSQYISLFTRSQWIFIIFFLVGLGFIFRKKGIN